MRERDRVYATTLGVLAGAFTTFATVPQIIHGVRTGRMADLSLTTLFMFALGVTLWMVYGIVIHAFPVVFWNAVSLALYLVLIAMRLRVAAAD